MTAGTASRHRYSIASWSPSQSEPLTVSNMCQRQSSFSMLPSAALMPPCAATVWLRVGKTLVTQAVFEPRCDHAECPPQSGAAGTEDDHVERVVDDVVAVGHCFPPYRPRKSLSTASTLAPPSTTAAPRTSNSAASSRARVCT